MNHTDLETRLIGERYAAWQSERARRWDRAGEIVAVAAVAALAVWTLLQYMEPCAALTLCTGPVVIPTRHNPLRRMLAWCRLEYEARMLRWRIRLAEEDVQHYESELLMLPLQIQSHERAIGSWRVQLIDAERAINDVRLF